MFSLSFVKLYVNLISYQRLWKEDVQLLRRTAALKQDCVEDIWSKFKMLTIKRRKIRNQSATCNNLSLVIGGITVLHTTLPSLFSFLFDPEEKEIYLSPLISCNQKINLLCRNLFRLMKVCKKCGVNMPQSSEICPSPTVRSDGRWKGLAWTDSKELWVKIWLSLINPWLKID